MKQLISLCESSSDHVFCDVLEVKGINILAYKHVIKHIIYRAEIYTDTDRYYAAPVT